VFSKIIDHVVDEAHTFIRPYLCGHWKTTAWIFSKFLLITRTRPIALVIDSLDRVTNSSSIVQPTLVVYSTK